MIGRRLHLVTFATADFAAAGDRLIASALRTGEFASGIAWDEERLLGDRSFRGAHLVGERGYGYWSWKPHVILETLKSLPEGDVVLYCDAGRYDGGFTIRRSVEPLVRFAEEHRGSMPGVAVPHFGPNARWTRRDCFVLMECDTPEFWWHPQVQTSPSVWVRSAAILDFVDEWARFGTDIRIVGDGPNTCGLPNLPGFRDHRHDQSVLTNLVVKRGLTPLTIGGRLFDLLVALRPQSAAANLFHRKIDNVSAVAGGTSPSLLYGRELVGSRLGRRRGAEA